MTISREWIEKKAAERRRLYEKYGKPLEADHAGKFVAISLDGEILLGEREAELFYQALDAFGRNKFALTRVGHEVMDEWSTVWPLHADADMMANSEWAEKKYAEYRRVYEKHVKPLEANHTGEFVAVSSDGEILLGKRDGETLRRALDKFGRGNFEMARVGYDVIDEWVTVWQ